ncbi:MAG: ADP-ribosylglycohydrolase family protein [Microcoleus sp.]
MSKFQGALLGAAIGDCLGTQHQRQLLGIHPPTENWQPILKLTKHQQLSLTETKEWQSVNGKHSSRKTPSECGRLAVANAQSLIRCSGLDLKDWRDTWETFTKLKLYDPQSRDLHTIINPSEAGISTVPAVIFFHENTAKLREKLMLATDVWQHQKIQEWQMGVLTAAYPIARALKEKLDPATAISQTISYLESDNAVTEMLSQVAILLKQGADLEKATTQLCKIAKTLGGNSDDREKTSQTHVLVNPANSLPISLAFYCFLSTPEDLNLSVVRAARCGISSQLTCALTGALSGSYNGVAAIPVEWRQALSVTSMGRSPAASRESSIWGTDDAATIVELATQLFDVWAGVYSPKAASESVVRVPVVTAPYVIRPHKT